MNNQKGILKRNCCNMIVLYWLLIQEEKSQRNLVVVEQEPGDRNHTDDSNFIISSKQLKIKHNKIKQQLK